MIEGPDIIPCIIYLYIYIYIYIYYFIKIEKKK